MQQLDLNDEKIRSLINERTKRLSEVGSIRDTYSEDLNLLCFLVKDEVWAVPISQVKEIFPFSGATLIPGAPGYVIGLTNLRGAVLTLVDISQMIGVGSTDSLNGSQVIVADVADIDIAFVADKLVDIVRVPRSSVEQPLWILDKVEGDFVVGEATIAEQLIGILDVNRIFSSKVGDQNAGRK